MTRVRYSHEMNSLQGFTPSTFGRPSSFVLIPDYKSVVGEGELKILLFTLGLGIGQQYSTFHPSWTQGGGSGFSSLRCLVDPLDSYQGNPAVTHNDLPGTLSVGPGPPCSRFLLNTSTRGLKGSPNEAFVHLGTFVLH